MPFTFSHPAIVLPLTYLPKKWYSLSGLIMGSITPDFEYFVRMNDFSKYSHTLKGMFWFDLPLGLMLIFIFHNLVRNTLITYLPFSFNVRFSSYEKFNWNKYFKNNIIVVLISLIVGIASHLFWDSFTHDGGFFADAIPILKERVDIIIGQVSVATILQYVCSIIGGIVLLIVVLKLPEGHKTRQKTIYNFWVLVSFFMIPIVTIRLYIYNHHNYGDIIIVTMMSGALIGIVFLSLLLKINVKQIFRPQNKIRNTWR